MDNKNEILIYEDKDGITKVNVTFTDEYIQKGFTMDDDRLKQSDFDLLIKALPNNKTEGEEDGE